MAEIKAKMFTDPDRVMRVLWAGLNETDDEGNPARTAQYPDRTVQVTGTFGGGSVTIQGPDDGSLWFALPDHAGAPLTFSDAGMKLVAECPLYMRPVAASGTGMAIDVIIVGCPRF